MAFRVREMFYGLEHLRLTACRSLFKMTPDAYMKRYAKYNVPVEVCLDTSDNPIKCELCGFVTMRAHLDNGWEMEMCSALAIVNIDKPAFRDWLTTLSRGSSDCQVRDFEPILHD